MKIAIGEKEINFLQNEGWKERQEGTRLSRKNVKPCTYLYNTTQLGKNLRENYILKQREGRGREGEKGRCIYLLKYFRF